LFDDIRNTVKEFISKRCSHSASSSEYCADVYQAYRQYCKKDGITPLEYNTFGVYLNEMGIQKIRPMVKGIRKYAYKGIKLK
jgi:phage/plasmid-associated DNA primase